MYYRYMTEKILGYVLIASGILIILFSGFNAYQVFTKQIEPVKLFNFKGISLDTNQLLAGSLPPELSQNLLKTGGSKTEIIPGGLINDSSNLFAHLLIVGVFINVGYKLASIGTLLVRPIKVILKNTVDVQTK